MICVREDHTAPDREAVNTIISLDLKGDDDARILAGGNDFYSSPRISPGGSYLAWLSWDHPNMPWDETELWMGELGGDGSLRDVRRVGGGAGESIFQPEWSPDGALYFVSDRTGWWNLYRLEDGEAEPLCEMKAEFGRPQWVFGMSTFSFESQDSIICGYNRGGVWHLARLDLATLELETIDTAYTEIAESLRAAPGRVVFGAGSPAEPLSIVELNLDTGRTEVLRRSSQVTVDPGYLSTHEFIEFPTERKQVSYALYYPPSNRDFQAPPQERPPLLVISHGGPTSAARASLNPLIQYWTSRGLAVADVDYGGSTGYGRAYRERLKGKWGVVDVDDCVNVARFLAKEGQVDGERLAIRGGSAGGFTTLSALTFRDVFKAGASYFGVSDLEALALETHKFESRYLDGLIGPYPEMRDLYMERSPIHSVDRLSCPLIVFQGLEDEVVPPNQAELMVEALRSKGLPVAYVTFEGEQHGFRKAENIKRALDSELYFYSKVFGFELPEPVEPVAIENL